MRGRYERKRNVRLRKIVLVIVGILLLFIFFGILVGIVYYRSMLSKINQVQVPEIIYTRQDAIREDSQESSIPQTVSEETVATTEPHVASSADYLNILVVGQAAREGESERFADTSVLCTINTHKKTITLTSLLRDSFVKMPDYKGKKGGRIKLTTIYHLGSVYGDGIAGSMELMNLTLFHNFGIEVDHNIEIDFDAFVRVIDRLDGIDMELTEAEAAYLNADDRWVYYDYDPGLAHLDGMSALSYARMRKAAGDGESDIIRTQRQRKLIEALFTKLKTKSLSEIQEIVNDILPMVSTSMSNSDITSYLLMLLPMLPELEIDANGTCPINYKGDSFDIYGDGVNHSILRFNQEETIKAMRAITEGEEQP